MSAPVKPRPELGQPLSQKPSPATLELLSHRRSASAMHLGLPGPTADEMESLIQIGLRVPDHGKLGPWRIVRFTPDTKARLVERLLPLADMQADPIKAKAALRKLSTPPEALLVISKPVTGHAIPVWEQQLSASAVCQNLLIAATAMGYGANWITDWYSYDETARAILGVTEHEQVAGFIYLGTATEIALERERPNPASRTSWWQN
jgi:nitroreductase